MQVVGAHSPGNGSVLPPPVLADRRGAPLVLQPNRFLRNILLQLLRGSGAPDVLLANHAGNAMETLAERLPSVIIMDWDEHEDPDEDRLRLIRRIRESEGAAFRDTPILFVTPPRSRRASRRSTGEGRPRP